MDIVVIGQSHARTVLLQSSRSVPPLAGTAGSQLLRDDAAALQRPDRSVGVGYLASSLDLFGPFAAAGLLLL